MSPSSPTSFRNSFGSRLFAIFTIFTSLIMCAFVAVFITSEIRNYQERTNEKARLLSTLLAGSIRLPLYAGNTEALTAGAEKLLESPQVARITIAGIDGRKLIELRSPLIPEGVDMVTASAPVLTTASPSAESALSGLTATLPGMIGTASVSIDTSDMHDVIRSVIFKSCGIALLFWLAVIMTCYPVLRRVTRSFDTLTGGLGLMMEGDFTGRIAIDSQDEAGRAAMAVNRLSDALVAREAENRQLQKELIEAMQRKLDEEKQQNIAKLIQTNRMTSLGLLVSSMAHEINNPNGAIRLDGTFLGRMAQQGTPLFELMERKDPDFRLGGLACREAQGELLRATENIIRNTGRIETVIKDLRSYSLGAETPFTPGLDPNRSVTSALTIIRAHGRYTNAVIREELAGDLPTVSGSHHQLEQVVVNLLLNALQALPADGGNVSISTRRDPESGSVVISISDTGEGIPPEHLERLFEPFFTTRIDSGGSGLGLYISSFIINEHGGRLEFDSAPGSGTTVRVWLPPSPE